jgi:hypothetical protein
LACGLYFQTVPTIFKQLYTIHGNIGSNENSRIIPLAYALMSCKTEEVYKALFQELIDFGDVQPQFIITDFEIPAIKATRAEFQVKDATSIYHKIFIAKCKNLPYSSVWNL